MDAGVADQLVLGDPTAPRFVYWENKLRATPSGPDIVTFDLLSIMGKIRAGLGAVGLFNAPMPGEQRQHRISTTAAVCLLTPWPPSAAPQMYTGVRIFLEV